MRTLSIIIFLVSVFSLNLFPQDFKNLSEDEGLSNHIVYSVSQYRKGLMWFSTKEGIDRFDGKKFKNYKLYGSDKIYQYGHRNSKLYHDRFNRLWVSNNYNIFLYNDNLDNFEEVFAISQTIIRDIYPINKNVLLIATDKGLCKYNIETKKTESYPKINKTIFRITPYDQKWVLLVHENRIIVFDINKGKTVKELLKPNIADEIKNNITALSVDSKKNIYIGIKGKILVTDISGKWIRSSATLNKNLKNCVIRKILLFKNHLYIGTDGAGMFKINPQLQIIKSYISDNNNPYSLADNTISDIFFDSDNRLWVTSNSAGISYFDPNKLKFQFFQHQPHNNNSLSHNYVRTLTEDNNENLWIGTKKGISIYNTKTLVWKHLSQNADQNNFETDKVFSLAKDQTDNILVGTYQNGLFSIDPNLRIKNTYPYQNKSIYSILSRPGRLWLGTSNSIFYKENDQEKSYTVSYALSITNDKKGNIIIGGHNGLSIIHTNGKMIKYDLDDYKTGPIFSVIVDSKERLWCASEGQGLIKFNTNKKLIKKYTMAHGLPSNIVYGILEDDLGYLWLSTTKGLSRFDTHTEKFINFSVDDGLPIKAFNYGAHVRRANGELVFGGINGFVIIDPKQVHPVNNRDNLIFTDFKIFNISSKIGHENSPLTKVIDETDIINLKHNQNAITFDFTSINYTNVTKTQFSWKLEGLDTEWSPPGSSNSAIYTSLKPGEYTFRVKAINYQSGFVSPERNISIIISPPFWKTTWAYLLYALIIICTTYGINKYYYVRLSEEHAKDKINFFINIAHDIRTPLSLIISPLSIALKKKDFSEETFKVLKTAEKNSQRLAQLINQLLDFEKADSNKSQLKLTSIHAENTIDNLCNNFEPLINERNIELKKDFKQKNTILFVDKDKFEKIIFNLLSNAVKYTANGGKIEITTNAVSSKYIIEVKDNGVGIPEEQQKDIFKRYFRAKNVTNSSITGSGIGLMLTKKLVELHKGTIGFESNEQKGSIFKITLPLQTVIEDVEPAEAEEKQESLTEDIAVSNTNKLPKLLIAEDDVDLRKYLVENLSGHYQVYEAENGKIAGQIAKKVSIDVIISDVMMPDVNGHQLCAQLKNDIETSHIPFILLTSLTSTPYKIDGIKAGADYYLEKPVDLELIITCIESLLENRKRLRNKFLKNELVVNEELSELDKKFIAKILKIMEENVSNPEFSIEVFQQEMGMSQAVIYRKFKILMGNTPLIFINHYRLKKAVELLQQGGYNVNEVAYMVGFSDPKYFSTSFKKLFGYNASELLKKGSK